MALGENDRAAAQLMDDYLRVHNRLKRARKQAIIGKQPKRTTPPVHCWRPQDNKPERAPIW